MDVLARIAEEKIREAVENGELDDLPGKGKPLLPEDLSRVPEELRAAYIILKNAGVLPEELQLKKEILNLQKMLACCSGEGEKTALNRRLNEKILRFNLLMERRKINCSGAARLYLDKVYKRLGL